MPRNPIRWQQETGMSDLDRIIMDAGKRLGKAGVENPMRDAQVLWEHAAKESGSRSAGFSHSLTSEAAQAFELLVKKREERQPVSQIIGAREFYGRKFEVTRDVLDPRPETETLVDAALESPFDSVLDLGTGSGCILITLLLESAASEGLGVDACPKALEVAKRNSRRLSAKGASFIRSDWYESVEGRFDLIVSNPPYVSAKEYETLSREVHWEPKAALTDGGSGLESFGKISMGAARRLNPMGKVIVEMGYGQDQEVCAVFRKAGFESLRLVKDLDGRNRVLVGKLAN